LIVAELALRESLRSLYSDHHGWLYAWLRRRPGCPDTAADLAHDTFLRLIASRDALPGLRQLRAYLTTTAKRLLVDRARRARIEEAYLAGLALAAEGGDGYPPRAGSGGLGGPGADSEALEGVPPRAQNAFLAHYLKGESYAEVAARLGVSTRMVRKYLVQVLVHCVRRASAADADSFRDVMFNEMVTVAPSFAVLPRDGTLVNLDFVYTDTRSLLDRGQPNVDGVEAIGLVAIEVNVFQPGDKLDT
jgi:RNA polymerase sigma-70 factor (ECF subfamily)